MDFALTYLVRRFFYRVIDFFHHWYADASKYLFHRFFLFLEGLDQTFALRITLKHFFQPLYKDYTGVGRILGIFFRSIRIILGTAVYALIAAVFFAFYLLWLAAPVAALFYAFTSR